MGWLYRKEIKGQRIQDAIRDYLKWGGSNTEIVSIAVSESVGYVAIRDTRSGEVSAIVVLYDRDRERGEIGFKVIGEGEGPYYYGAPGRVLRALTPTTDPRAIQWREACRVRSEKIARLRGDLTGRTIALWGARYRITGRSYARARSWQGIREDSGVLYTIRSKQIKEADLLD